MHCVLFCSYDQQVFAMFLQGEMLNSQQTDEVSVFTVVVTVAVYSGNKYLFYISRRMHSFQDLRFVCLYIVLL